MKGAGQRIAVTVDGTAAGERLDRWLAASLGNHSRSRIKALIEAGRVTLAAATITDPSSRVKLGQTYEIVVPEPEPALPEPEPIPLVVLYEDADLIVIDKQAGLAVHPAPGSPSGTLVNALIAHCGASLSGIAGVRRPGIVHRLDKDTTGIMVVAKTDFAHQDLAGQFARRTVERAYLALVWGVPHPAQGVIAGNIGRDPRDRKRMAVVSKGGKAAQTRYRLRRAFGLGAALIECRLDTGRTHQIRVHFAGHGHPLIGDATYGRTTAARLARLPEEARAAVSAFHRQALHAHILGFCHPHSQEWLEFTTPPPFDMAGLLTTLEPLQGIHYS